MTITGRAEPRVTFGALLRQARRDAHMEQSELAAAIGSGRSSIGKWERDESVPTFDYVRKIVEATRAEWLYTEPFKDAVRTRIGWNDESAGQSLAMSAA